MTDSPTIQQFRGFDKKYMVGTNINVAQACSEYPHCSSAASSDANSSQLCKNCTSILNILDRLNLSAANGVTDVYKTQYREKYAEYSNIISSSKQKISDLDGSLQQKNASIAKNNASLSATQDLFLKNKSQIETLTRSTATLQTPYRKDRVKMLGLFYVSRMGWSIFLLVMIFLLVGVIVYLGIALGKKIWLIK